MRVWVTAFLMRCSGAPDPVSTLPVVNKDCIASAPKVPADAPVFVAKSAPAAATTEPAKEVTSTAVEARRISGRRVIMPDDDTKTAISRSGVAITRPMVKLCLAVDGSVSSARIESSSCFPRYDAAIIEGVSQWRYSPFLEDGVPKPVCTHVTFVYSQR